MSLSVAVIIATKGRPQELFGLLKSLAAQTAVPDFVVVSACSSDDIGPVDLPLRNVETVFGSPGSSVQRNRALSLVRGKYYIVVFFDDDFIPSRYWIEHIQMLLSAESSVVGVTGEVLADGVMAGGFEWPDGQSMVNKMDSSRKQITM